MRAKPNMLAVAAVLAVPAIAAWVVIVYICHALVTGAAVVLDIISRSL